MKWKKQINTEGNVLNNGPTAKQTTSIKALETKAKIWVFPPTPSKIADLDKATQAGKPLKKLVTIFPTP